MKNANAAAVRPEQRGGPVIELLDFSHEVHAHVTGVKVELKVNGEVCIGSVKSVMGTVDAMDKAVRMAVSHMGVLLDSRVESKDSQSVRVVVRYRIGAREVEFRATDKDEAKAYLLAVLEAVAGITGGIIMPERRGS